MTGFAIKEALKYFVALPENISCVFMDNHSPDNGTAIDITLKLSERKAGVLSFCSFVFSALVIFEYIYNFFDKKKQHDSIIVGVMLFLYKRFNLPVQIAKKSQ
ncbi:hypothetical protein [Streptococcus sinensis]|uniref:Uncharacterized protein n=1 Tax=Streptococcus sinensis TaxID=176090 RepID=A0A0A0DGT0_9STRE|nr:hypothetical protein [Streptococcus sinensis]KGM37921.1 hypothetical protein SSIN_0299 [Streptococcus sinensis]